MLNETNSHSDKIEEVRDCIAKIHLTRHQVYELSNYKLNPEIKQAWLAALESGQFTQGTGTLKCNNRHCCLGVLAEIHPDLQGKLFGGGADNNARLEIFKLNYTSTTYLPETIIPKAIQTHLANLNDCSDSFVPTIQAIKEAL